jgi:hypothetical protein
VALRLQGTNTVSYSTVFSPPKDFGRLTFLIVIAHMTTVAPPDPCQTCFFLSYRFSPLLRLLYCVCHAFGRLILSRTFHDVTFSCFVLAARYLSGSGAWAAGLGAFHTRPRKHSADMSNGDFWGGCSNSAKTVQRPLLVIFLVPVTSSRVVDDHTAASIN